MQLGGLRDMNPCYSAYLGNARAADSRDTATAATGTTAA